MAEKIKVISELAKANKNIDVSALILNAMQNQDKKLVTAKQKRWAYLVSIGLPPFGLLFALKYFYGELGESAADNAAQAPGRAAVDGMIF